MVWILKKGASKKDVATLREQLLARKTKGVDTKKFCGILKLKEDPMQMQKKMRDE